LNENISDEQIDELCALCAEEHDGAQRTLAYLAYKAQSPQEYEALQALTVMEKVVKRGGYRIADEVGKFRFLNEVIKIVSSKVLCAFVCNILIFKLKNFAFLFKQYLAYRISEKVRLRIVELIFAWSMEFKELPKIFE